MSIFNAPLQSKVRQRSGGHDYDEYNARQAEVKAARRRWNRNDQGTNHLSRNVDTGQMREQLTIDPHNPRGIGEGFAMLSDEFGA